MRIGFLLIAPLLFLSLPLQAFSEDLEIQPGDAYIELSENGEGFDLYIRAAPGLGSILITESTADPLKQADSFSFRAWDYNPINGDERRILNGQFLESSQPQYFLLDSSPEENALLGSAFHIYVPFQLTYGYPWSREGQVEVHRGTWLNIRAFEKPYADYRGNWKDNPFILSMKEMPPPPIEEIEEGPVESIEAAVERISEIIEVAQESVDVVLVVDTTISMKNDIGFIREALVPLVKEKVEGFKSFRVGLVLYRDYKEAYLTRHSPFSSDLNILQQRLNEVTTGGGRDLPEAVNEGLFAALTEYEWQALQRIIIQVGDAPAHEKPRGAITEEMVTQVAEELGVEIYTIRLPNK